MGGGIGGVIIDGAPNLPTSGVGVAIGANVATLPDMNGDGTLEMLISNPIGESSQVTVLFSPASWRPETNVYGSNDDDVIGVGDGAARPIWNGSDEVYGFAGKDTITTADGDDILNGGGGADILIGGLGNDSYVVDNLADRVQEAVGAGIDNVSSTSASWTMNANVENQAINGAGNVLANRMVGDAANNTLDGGAGVDTLIGNGGNDALIGGAGDDAMTGGSGNDTYNLDAAGDSVTEVRVDTGTAGYTRIPIDTDDVGIRVNMEIRVANEGTLPALTAGDFML